MLREVDGFHKLERSLVAVEVHGLAGERDMMCEFLYETCHEGTFELVESIDLPKHSMTWGEKAKRIAITVIGATLVVGGIVLTPLPGPWSLPIVIGGLAVLSQEYDWAKDAREWVRSKSKQVAAKLRARRRST